MGDSDTSRAFTERFDAAVERLGLAGRRVLVAFSGGLDSTLLLHALDRSALPREIAAIHVDHGLHEDSAAWSTHCAGVAKTLGIGFVTRRLALAPSAGESVEAAAREARYAVLAEAVGPGEVVVTAHHADDQLETVLLRLMRGTGVRGLTAIRDSSPLGPGWLARPLLGFSRAEIEAEAERQGLGWLEDPSNADTRFDRNFLRAKVLPALRERWPKAGFAAARLARQMVEADTVLSEVAAGDLAAADELERIPVDLLESLSEPRRGNALRHAVRALGLPLPSATQLAELMRVLDARDDAEVVVGWPGAEARVFRRRLYLKTPGHAEPPQPGRIDKSCAFRFADGELRLVAADGYGIPDRWARGGLTVAFRRGGERFRPNGSRHHKTLKHWFQEAGIVPWMRPAVPLLYHERQLVAVGDLCLADDLPQSPADAPFWRPVWSGHSRLR
ncbi:MAG TPA: tRNA lysidine(34) synthetase TilS [Gammaproteobacteria bacterium]|nr:tRNA lysidine(34) synthetase TilS [Gammaproteobacteria bacterium]